MLHVIAQAGPDAMASQSIFTSLSVGDRRERRLAASALVHGADERDGGVGAPAHGGAADHDWQQEAASRLRARHGDTASIRRRRVWGILGAFYPGCSLVPAPDAAGAAARQ